MKMFASRINKNGTQIRAERARVSMPASIMTMSAYQFPELADISRTGARLKGPSLPPVGTEGLLRAGTVEVLCRVIWVQEGQCGLRFDEPVSTIVLKQVQLDGSVALEPLDEIDTRPPGSQSTSAKD